MSWDVEMPIILRNVINDVSDTPKYPDSRLRQLILVAGQLLQQDVNFQADYVLDISNLSIAPDPTLTATRDDAFINLAILRSACLLSMGELRRSGSGVVVKDINFSIDTRKNMAGNQLIVENFCNLYNQAKWEYQSGNGTVGEAVLGPYKYASFPIAYPNIFFGGNRTNRNW